MSQTKNAVELCALIVDDIYGELCSRIFAVLLRRGRLTIGMLIQQTRLTSSAVQHGLAVLIQQNLAYYSSEQNAGGTFYEANIEAAYSLLRTGKVLEVINQRHGEVAKEFTKIVMLLGHAKVSDIAGEYDKQMRQQKEREASEVDVDHDVVNGVQTKGTLNGHDHGDQGSTNGTTRDQWHTSGEMDEALWELLEAGLLEPVTKPIFHSPSDTYNAVEKQILDRDYGGSLRGPKQKEEIKSVIRDRLRDLRSEGREVPLPQKKRAVNGDKKRRLTNGHASNGIDNSDVEMLDRNLVLRVNYEKCMVALRSQYLIKLAAHNIGKTTSQIYAQFLRLLEKKIVRCRRDPSIDEPEDDDSRDSWPTVSVLALEAHLDPKIDTSTGIGKASTTDIHTISSSRSSQKRKYGGASDEEEADDDSTDEHGNIKEVIMDDDDGEETYEDAPTKPVRSTKVTFQESKGPRDRASRLNDIRKHMQLLEDKAPRDHATKFVTCISSDSRGEYAVDFKALMDSVRKKEMDATIHQHFGKTGLRLSQIMRQRGKLDEKVLANSALMKTKDARTKLAQMQRLGFCDVQEIPRDASRAVNRMIFLWYFDLERVQEIVLGNIYKTMARSLEVLECEKLMEHETLTLAERSDVQGHEEEFLSKDAYNRWEIIREKEMKILAQIGRIDDLVGVFKDF